MLKNNKIRHYVFMASFLIGLSVVNVSAVDTLAELLAYDVVVNSGYTNLLAVFFGWSWRMKKKWTSGR